MSNNTKNLPLLLLDDASSGVFNVGTYKFTNISFEEAKHILEVHEGEDEILQCISNRNVEEIIFNYLGVEKRVFPYKKIRNMREGQNAIVFKLYITPSETQPVIKADDGVEAKKIQNVYVYCQYVVRIE